MLPGKRGSTVVLQVTIFWKVHYSSMSCALVTVIAEASVLPQDQHAINSHHINFPQSQLHSDSLKYIRNKPFLKYCVIFLSLEHVHVPSLLGVHDMQKVCKQGRDDIIVKVNLQSLIPASFSH